METGKMSVDLLQMEKLAQDMCRMHMDAEDILGRLKQLNGEISYDEDILLFPESSVLLGNIEEAGASLLVLENMFYSLYDILKGLLSAYETPEKQE